MNQKIPGIKELYNVASKDTLQPAMPFVNESWHARVYDRKLSIYLTWVFLHTNLSANQITFLGILSSLTGAYFLSFPHIPYLIVGAFFYQFYVLLDNSDGEIARYKKHTSASGIYFDKLMHSASKTFLLISVSVSAFRLTSNVNYLVLGLTTTIIFLISVLIYHLDPYMDRGWFGNIGGTGKKGLIFYLGAAYTILVGEIENVYFLLVVGTLFLFGLTNTNPYALILLLNLVLISGNTFYSLARKIYDPRYK
jgi:phosphatidylglycerophosphate synthase